MVAPAPESHPRGPDPSRIQTIRLLYRDNQLFRQLLPRVEEELSRQLGLPVVHFAFPQASTPPEMQADLVRQGHSEFKGELLVTDISVRRGIRGLNGQGEALLAAAHDGVLLDRSLATAVKALLVQELRRPLLERLTSTPSAEERARTGELSLAAEKIFFEALLYPLVCVYPQHRFVIAAPKLMHHVPFVTHIGGLQETYLAKHGRSDSIITEKLLAFDHPDSILSLPRIPPDVRSRLLDVATDRIQDPCDWLRDILISLGCDSSRLCIADSAEDLVQILNGDERHLQVLLADRHLIEPRKLAAMLTAGGKAADFAGALEAKCLAGPTFRLPLENLVTDLADKGILNGTTLLCSGKVRDNLARLIVAEVVERVQGRGGTTTTQC